MHVLMNTTNYDYGQVKVKMNIIFIRQARKDTVFGDYYIDSIDDDDDQINGSSSEEDNSSCDDNKLLDQRTISVSYTFTTPSRINVLHILAQLLLVSKRVLVAIIQSLNPLLEIFNEKSLNKERIDIIRSSMLDKMIDFLKPWIHVMKRIQSLQVSSIHTVTPNNSSTSSTTFQLRKTFSLHYVLPRFDKAFQEAVRDSSSANFGAR
ncbi:unnamed protein product [Rotaria sordida]|uniref:Uncharacterized protein n=1 Tax=Rotaria sordida TaxID=392033 RepID=A0A813YBS1_9BILA|nr:unnamed protein product [Rotaria sordida]